MINKKFGLILAAGVLSLAACGEEQTGSNEDPEPEVTEQESPAEEEEAEEGSVEDSAPEAVSGAASELFSNGESTSFVFNETGEFSIFCEPHPNMVMTVLVEEGAELTDEVAVTIADLEFGEETITVAPGTTIVWTNQDEVQHNVAFK
ncbi:plastocyanin/azurin family copper-binding protein [Planococcus sp. X10-3]|uniref:plastocyanin/azurin family copper-binding protein n=1 Tax=Planococcus sp. X10-3 TaxID=3061240 RepID=UPI003BB0D723